MFKIEIDNYRSFKKQSFDFSKMNILIGENSSGKSSLIKLFLALKQTIQTPTNRETLLALTGELVDLGNYKENIYYHNEELPLTLKFTFNSDYYNFYKEFFTIDIRNKKKAEEEISKIQKLIGGPIKEPTILGLEFNKNVDQHESILFNINNKEIGKLELIFFKSKKQTSHELFFGKMCGITYFDNHFNELFELNEINYEKDGFLSFITAISLHDNLEKILGITELKKKNVEIPLKLKAKYNTLFHKIAFLLVSQNYLKYYLDKIEYINPINTQPSRIYLNKDNRQNKKIQSIEDVVDFFSGNNLISKKILY